MKIGNIYCLYDKPIKSPNMAQVLKSEDTVFNNIQIEPSYDDLSYKDNNANINTKQKNSNVKFIKNIAIIGGVVVFGILLIRNKNSTANVERHFKNLYKDIPKAQKRLKNVFGNETLSGEDTINILKRYERIERESFNMTKEECAKIVFEEAKNNFNLRDNITLEFGKLKKIYMGIFCPKNVR